MFLKKLIKNTQNTPIYFLDILKYQTYFFLRTIKQEQYTFF